MAAETAESRTIVIVGQGGIQTDLDLDSLADAEVADVIPDMLADYSAECKDWTLIAREHWRAGRWARAEELLVKGIKFFGGARSMDHMALVNLHVMLAHLHLALSRNAPKAILATAKFDILKADTRTKDYHWNEVTNNLNRAEEALRGSGAGPEDEPVSLILGKILLYLARGQPGTAHPMVDRLLQKQPNNLMALMAQARLQFARRQHDAALSTYQKMLSLQPDMKPDPRVGLGLCAWVLGDRKRARAAWERAMHRDPDAWAPVLLLGLSLLNMAREVQHPMDKRLKYEAAGVSHVQTAFKLNNKSTAAALALTVVASQGDHIPLAAKLAERAIQFADNKSHSVLANSERGRLGFITGDVLDAGRYIAAAKNEDPQNVNVMAELTLAQIAIKNGRLREALDFVEQTAKRLAGKGPIEFTVLHASLLAYPHLGMPADELARNQQTARTMLSDVQGQMTAATTDEDLAKLRGVAMDSDVFVELAKLWQEESMDKAITSYKTAISIKRDLDSDEFADSQAATQVTKPVDYAAARLSANLASLYSMQGQTESAEEMLQDALQKLTSESGKEADMLKTVIAYDLGRANEQGGDAGKATQWYRDVLKQHPEHMESKVRLSTLASAAGRNVDAHNYLKECLRADESNLILRSAYTNFLISIGSYKEALAFTSQTLKFDRKDAFTFTALGWLHFTLGREAKTPADVAERSKQYLRSAEAYERAIALEPSNAIAAQGLAIALAEDTLVPKSLQATPGSADELKTRARLAGQALSILGRIKDSLPEGPVNVNIGHCYFIRGEEERAIEAYGAALNAYGGRKVPVLLYLCRAWYAYAIKESNFSAMGQALRYATRAFHIQPIDRAILYNIAMIQQKAAEIMLGLDPSKRMLDELQFALNGAQDAVGIFRTLADDKSGPLPYDADLADQRARYGEGLLRRGLEQVAKQEAYEGETAARVEEARRVRAAEQARIEAAAAARQAEIDARAAELAKEREQAREEAREWQQQLAAQLAEDETRKAERAEQRKRKKEDRDIVDDDAEGGGGGEERRSRKKKEKGERKKRKKSVSDDEMDVDDGGAGSGEEDPAAARNKTLALLRKKKRGGRAVHEDPDGDDDGGASGRPSRGKQFKSKAIIEDSDDDSDDGGAASPAAPSPPASASGSEAGGGGGGSDAESD